MSIQEGSGSRLWRDQRRGWTLLAGFFVAISVLGFVMVREYMMTLKQRHYSLIREMELGPNQEAVNRVVELLQNSRVEKDAAGRMLTLCLSPKVHVRSQYAAGKPIYVSVSFPFTMSFRRLFPRWRVYCVADNARAANQYSDSEYSTAVPPGQSQYPYYFLFSDRPIIIGQPIPVMSVGRYAGRIHIDYELIPLKTSGDPMYSCSIDLPFDVHVVPINEITPIQFISSPNLDESIRKAFVLSSETSRPQLRGISLVRGPVIEYRSIPEDVALRARFEDAHGKRYVSEYFQIRARKGASGFRGGMDLPDVIEGLGAGSHKGKLILFSDHDLAFTDPEIKAIWKGEVVFDVIFDIESESGAVKPQPKASGRHLGSGLNFQ